MRLLKALVIVMGVLIVAGLAVVVTTLANRGGSGADRRAGAGVAPVPPVAGDPAGSFGDVTLAIPAGARIAAATVAEGRLVVTLSLDGGESRIMVVDLASGRRLGTVTLAPGAAAGPAPAATP